MFGPPPHFFAPKPPRVENGGQVVLVLIAVELGLLTVICYVMRWAGMI